MDSKFEHLKIAEYSHWDLYLHENQYYLGRLYIWAHRDGKIDKTEMTTKERDELEFLEKRTRAILYKLWRPDLINWCFLQNHEGHGHHLHEHVIPRYKEPRTIEIATYTDERWGQNYSPSPVRESSPGELEHIRLLIKYEL